MLIRRSRCWCTGAVIGIVIMGAGIITIAGTGIIGGIVTIGTGITGTGTTGTTVTGKAANW
jgi:hypothetical protein